MEEESHDDAGGVVCQPDHVGLLALQGEDEEGLYEAPDDSEGYGAPPVHPALGETEEAEDGDHNGELHQGEEPGGDGQGGPVHAPQVPDDH